MASGGTEARQAIRAAAFHLMVEEGFHAANYTRIAEKSGQGRSLVQYYFPKKEDIAVELVLDVLSVITCVLGDSGLLDGPPEARVMRMGQIYYSLLLRNDNSAVLTYDLLSDRAITGRVVVANAEGSIPLYSGEDGLDADKLREASIKATGGVYELLRLRIGAGEPNDPADLAAQNTAAFLAFIGVVGYAEGYDLCMGWKIDQAVADGLVEALIVELRG